MWIVTNCGKLLKRWEDQTILPVSWETCTQVKKQQLESCMEQLIGSRLRKENNRAECCHPVCLIYNWAHHEECWAGWVTSWNQDWGGVDIINLRYADDTTLMAESEEELKSLLMRVKEESEKAGLKLSIKKLRSWHLAPLLHGK